RQAYAAERAGADASLARNDVPSAWQHLERAHVIAQPFAVTHVGAHAAMLRLGWRTRDSGEIAGQLVRIAVAGPASLRGRIPVGNTGRARVPLRQRMPVPADLLDVVDPV
ncbi:MAG: DUF3703 domain-containing protein, partial [Acidimicrobiales bacterium]